MNDGGDPHRVLARNAACHQCRRRKLKCDAVRPTCGNCRKPRQRGPEKFEPPEPCTWDQYRDPSARTLRKREAKHRRSTSHGRSSSGDGISPPQWPGTMDHHAHPLSAPVYGQQPVRAEPLGYTAAEHGMAGPSSGPQHLQHATGAMMSADAYGANGQWAAASGMSNATTMHGHPAPQPSSNGGYLQMHNQPQHTTAPPSQNPLRQHPPVQQPPPPPPPSHHPASATVPPVDLNSHGMFIDGAGTMVWSEWPRDLPSEDIVRHIFQVFFDRVCVIPKMMHRATVLASLSLPPHAQGFPALALIHGVLAVTTPYLAPDAVASRAYFPIGTNAADTVHPEYDFVPRSTLQPASMPSFSSFSAIGDGTAIHRFQMWHRRKSLESMSELMTTGTKLVQMAQALVCVTWVDMMNGWWSDMWMESANAVRVAVPLSLHLSSTTNNDPLSHNVGEPIGPAQTALEQAERDRTWWMIYMTERCSGFGTTWVQAISHDEITVELPVTQQMFDHRLGSLLGVQTLESPDLLSNHPPAHMDAFPLLLKTIYLFSNTISFIRRYSRGEHTYARYLSDPGLRKCLNDINTFRMHCPASMRRPIQRDDSGVESIDPDLFYCLNLTHAAVLNLGGPLITKLTWTDEGANMILHAVRAILSLLYDLNSTSFDITLLPVVNSFAWYLAGRCLIRFSAAAHGTGDHVQASIFESELQTLSGALLALGQRHPVSLRYHKILGMLAEKPPAPAGEIIPLKNKTELFDSEFSSGAPRKTTSSGSANMSPNTYITDPSGSTPTGLNASLPKTSGVTPPQMSGNSPAHLPHVTVSPAGGPLSGINQHHQHIENMYPSPGHDWFKTDSFDISSYSFDVEAMSEMLTRSDPNATFNGSMMFPQHTM